VADTPEHEYSSGTGELMMSSLCTSRHTRAYVDEYSKSGPMFARGKRLLVGDRLYHLLAARWYPGRAASPCDTAGNRLRESSERRVPGAIAYNLSCRACAPAKEVVYDRTGIIVRQGGEDTSAESSGHHVPGVILPKPLVQGDHDCEVAPVPRSRCNLL
jgi:hypothetical protein